MHYKVSTDQQFKALLLTVTGFGGSGWETLSRRVVYGRSVSGQVSGAGDRHLWRSWGKTIADLADECREGGHTKSMGTSGISVLVTQKYSNKLLYSTLLSKILLGMQMVLSPPGLRSSRVCGEWDSPIAQNGDRTDIPPPLAGDGTALTSGNAWRGRSHDCSFHRTAGNSSASLVSGVKEVTKVCGLSARLTANSSLTTKCVAID